MEYESFFFKRNHCLQESHFKLAEQLKLRKKTTISFYQTQHENENKVEKLLEDLANFEVGTKKQIN